MLRHAGRVAASELGSGVQTVSRPERAVGRYPRRELGWSETAEERRPFRPTGCPKAT